MIEDGKITAPVEGATLVGNGADTLMKIVAVGNDSGFDRVYTCGKDGQSVPVNVGQPTLRLDGVPWWHWPRIRIEHENSLPEY